MMKKRISILVICVFMLFSFINVSAENVYNFGKVLGYGDYILINQRDQQDGNFGLCSNKRINSDGECEIVNKFSDKAPLPRFLDAVNGALNFVKVLVPLILIIVCLFEYIKAVVAGDEKGLANATKNSIKRLVIAVSVFIIPSVVQLIFFTVTKVDGFTIGKDCQCTYDATNGFVCKSIADSCSE